jgi:hypothetical protein
MMKAEHCFIFQFNEISNKLWTRAFTEKETPKITNQTISKARIIVEFSPQHEFFYNLLNYGAIYKSSDPVNDDDFDN